MKTQNSQRSLVLAVILPFLMSAPALSGETANDIARQLMPDLDKFQAAYERAKRAAAQDGGNMQPGGRSRSWRPGGVRTRGFHSDNINLEEQITEHTEPKVEVAEKAVETIKPTQAEQPKQKAEQPRQEVDVVELENIKPAVETQFAAVQEIETKWETVEITFEHNSAVIDATGRAMLDYKVIPAIQMVHHNFPAVARSWGLNETPENSFRVFGHTDASGDDHYNWELSERRARAVCAYLHNAGYPKALECRGFGESQLKDVVNDRSRVNRRVEISFMVRIKKSAIMAAKWQQ